MTSAHRAKALVRATQIVALFFALLAAGIVAFVTVGDEGFTEAFYRTLGAFTSANIVAEPDPGAERAIAAALTVAGGLFYLALVGTVVEAIVIRNAVTETWHERTSRRKAARMHNHFIVCGYGRVGRALTTFLRENGRDVVVVELKQDHRGEIARLGATLVIGDADDREILNQAGAQRARALIACVGSDAGNVYIALAAKRCHPGLFVAARASDHDAELNLRSATEIVDKVFSPHESMGQLIGREVLAQTGG